MLSRNSALILIFLFCLLSKNAFSQAKEETFKIGGVTVEGNVISDPETIISISGLRVGEEISYPIDEKVTSAIRNLWKRKQFADVDIVVDRISPMFGIFLTIKVKEFPRLTRIRVYDNEEVRSEDIAKKIGKIRGDIVSPNDVYLAQKAVKELYKEEGLMFAKVEVELVKEDSTELYFMDVTVDEGIEYKVGSITFNGNKIMSNDELISAMDNVSIYSWWKFWSSARFDFKELEKDKKLLSDFYKRKGFIDAEILRDSLIFDENKQRVHIEVVVNEGERFFVRKINFNGNTVFPNDLLVARLDFKEGDPYDLERFEMNLRQNQDMNDVASLYQNTGYLAVQFDKKERRVGTDSVDIEINVFERERFKVRRVDIVGNNKTKDKVIRRELFTHPGDYFNRGALIRSVRALGAMNYFNPEALQPQIQEIPNDNTSIDILYRVEERSTDTFNASIGFAGTFGLTGALGFTFNNFSLTEPLKGGGGELFNFNWEFGQLSRLRSFSIGYTQPWLNDKPVTVGFNLFDTRIRWGFDLQRTGIAANIGRRLRWPDDYFRADWSVRYQINQVGEGAQFTFYRPGLTNEVTVGQTISRISIDNMFFPTVGTRASLSTQFALGSVGLGNTDFVKAEFNYDTYAPLVKVDDQNKLVFFMSSRMGVVKGISNDTTITPIELYRMGGNGLGGFGITSLRGYPDQSIERNGGRMMARFITEMRFAISQNPMPIFIYTFAEAGNVWSDITLSNPFDLKRSAGIGLQMLLNPIGIIGFSYGYGFDATRVSGGEPSGWQFLFHLGQQF